MVDIGRFVLLNGLDNLFPCKASFGLIESLSLQVLEVITPVLTEDFFKSSIGEILSSDRVFDGSFGF